MSRLKMWILSVLAMFLLAAPAGATIITVDLTQSGTESSGVGIAGDTWRWNSGDDLAFDLEFSSGNGSDLDLDGGAKAGSEYYTGTEGTGNHTYDVIRATYLSGNAWQIDALRGLTTYAVGQVTEYTGNLSHAANYDQSGSESHPVYGPPESGGPPPIGDNTQPTYTAWLWLYRDTGTNTVSLNLVAGSARFGGGDGGQVRLEVLFGGSFTGTPSIQEANEGGELVVNGGNPNQFDGDWGWTDPYDDGGSVGAITPIATQSGTIPEPGTWALFGLGALLLAARRRRTRPVR